MTDPRPLLAELDRLIGEAPRNQLPALVAALAARLATAAGQQMAASLNGSGDPTRSEAEDGKARLLRVAEVAERLALAKPYVYELIRRGLLPSLRIGDKYVRVSEAALRDWIAHTEQESAPRFLSGVYNRGGRIGKGGRRGTSPDSPRARPNTEPVRRAPRAPLEHAGPPRARRASHPGAGCEVRSTSGEESREGPEDR